MSLVIVAPRPWVHFVVTSKFAQSSDGVILGGLGEDLPCGTGDLSAIQRGSSVSIYRFEHGFVFAELRIVSKQRGMMCSKSLAGVSGGLREVSRKTIRQAMK